MLSFYTLEASAEASLPPAKRRERGREGGRAGEGERLEDERERERDPKSLRSSMGLLEHSRTGQLR